MPSIFIIENTHVGETAIAILLNTLSEEHVVISVQHTFGRNPNESSTVLNNPKASRMHAVIIWDGDHWFLRDSSTNGTTINDVRVLPGVKAYLKKNDKIEFGDTSFGSWLFIEASAPKNMLVSMTPGFLDIVLEDLVALPSQAFPEVTLYMASDGHWVCESQSGTSILQAGDRVGTKNAVWCFIEARPGAETRTMNVVRSVKQSRLQTIFDVSQNEEHVSLKLIVNNQEADLGQRNHHYLLLLLARKRMADQVKGLVEHEQGWIDKGLLGKMAGLNESHINIQVYRFRKRLMTVLPRHLELSQVVEKRRGEIRFNSDEIVINGGFG